MSPRTDTHSRIVDDLTHHHATEVAEAIRRLMDARPALPGAGGQGGGGRVKGSHADPTLSLAMKPDRVAAEITQLDGVLRRMSVDAQWLRSFVDRWQPHAPTDRDRREVERVNAETVPECWVMRRHTDTFEPALCTSSLGGLLDGERPVCRWVYDFARRLGRLPGAEECQRHAAGQKVRVLA